MLSHSLKYYISKKDNHKDRISSPFLTGLQSLAAVTAVSREGITLIAK